MLPRASQWRWAASWCCDRAAPGSVPGTQAEDVRRPQRLRQEHHQGRVAPRVAGLLIEQGIRERLFLDLGAFGVATTGEEILPFFLASTLIQRAGLVQSAQSLGFSASKLFFPQGVVNSYFAAVAADFVRRKLVEQHASFTFETVMSSPDKVALLQKAQGLGYRTYLYYVATEDPLINISRVRNRVRMGGHPVPEDKIVSRYRRSLGLLWEAIRFSNRAYIFDNSGEQQLWLAEVEEDVLEVKAEPVPAWFQKFVLDKIAPPHESL